MKDLYEKVKAFMVAGDQPIKGFPGIPDEKTLKLGVSLIKEELSEYIDAISKVGKIPDKEVMVDAADAIADLLYVVTWNSIAWGFPMDQIMEEVQRTNMAKFGPGSYKDNTGKVRKPKDWVPPNIKKFI